MQDIEKFIPVYNNYPVYFFKEFLEMKLDNKEKFKHQKFLSRYFGNIFIDSHELLLFHDMGSGKTNSAVAIIERLMELYPHEYKGAIILTKGQGLVHNFVREIVKCTDGKYDVETSEDMSDRHYRIKIKKNIEEIYTFFTFEVFVKMIKDMSNTLIRNRFESYIFIVDEVHNIRDNESTLNTYEELHRFFHILKHRKILLMSGTPMKDNPDEIASIMNLILPPEKQMPTDNLFALKYFENGKLINKNDLKSFFKGRISFLKSGITDVKKKFHGKIEPPLKYFKIIALQMSETQNRGYENAWKLDHENVNIYSNTRQASQFVDEHFQFGKKVKSLYNDIKMYSCKYDALIKNLIPGELSLVYLDIVRGSGLHALVRCLESIGYTREIRKPKSFVLLTSNLTEVQKQHYIKIFNSPENVFGDLISILIGSRVIVEGYTFNNVIHEHILTPHWNFSETSQVIARGWRTNSHTEYIRRTGTIPVVNVYMYAAIPKSLPSIDMMMYKISEQKDISINQIVRVIQESAIDCWLFKDQNNTLHRDGERECQYMTCEYVCDEERLCTDPILYDQYDLYHFKFSDQWNSFLENLISSFRTKWVINWSELGCFRNFQIAQIVLYCVQNHVIFINPNRTESHIRYNETGLFLVPLYYSGDMITEAYLLCKYQRKSIRISYDDLVLKYTMDNVQEYIKLFYKCVDYKQCVKIMTHFPMFLQQVILENVLKLIVFPNPMYEHLLEFILKYYESSIFQNDDYVGYVLDKVWCIGKNTGKCVSNDAILEYFDQRKKYMENNSFGYYGQENRDIDEFCIKIANIDTTNILDKRKIQSGRRCINWSKPELIELATKIMGNSNYDDFSRQEICKKLQYFFKTKNLLEHDSTCGTQYKKKA